MDINSSVRSVEGILKYKFKNRKLLKEALTHSSITNSPSYERLEFIGDAALGISVSKYLFLTYPDLEPGQLTNLRSANVNNEKLARVAVITGLYHYVHHKVPFLEDKFREFAVMVEEEEEIVVHGGEMAAPKILADIVESVAAAVYVDCNYDVDALWNIFRALLEPIVTPEVLLLQPQPITKLYDQCQKDGKHVDIKQHKEGGKSIASVYVDGKLIASRDSEEIDNAKFHAAKAALQELFYSETNERMDISETGEIEGAKQKLNELCVRKKWPKPHYSTEKATGVAHERRFLCSCQFEINENVVKVVGDEKSRLKDAENSAASTMLHCLREDYKYI